MKLSKISLALAAACGALASAPAFAIPASAYTNTSEFVGTTQNIRISGATAQDFGILGSALSYCTPGSMTRFQISNNFAFFCTPDIGTGAGQIQVRSGTPAVTQLAIYKYSAGGSGNGVAPVSNNATLPFLDLAKIATSPACSGTNQVVSTLDFDGAGPLATYVNIVCGGASSLLTTPAIPYIGLSDVEPAFFANAANTANLLAETAYTLLFAVPVTKNVRDALQAQQGLTVNSDTLANMPSLSQAQITSAFTQPGQTWANIGVNTGLADDTIYVTRRVDSSGTQKTFEALIAKTSNGEAAFKSCPAGTVDGFVTPDSGTTTGDASATCNSATPPLVFAGSGGGDVANCMNFHNVQLRGSIGIQTAEAKPAAAAGWRFVKVDGNAPTHADVAAGKYGYWTASSLNTRINVNPTLSAPGYGGTNFFVDRLKKDFANPTTITLINGGNQTFGPSGLMANLPSGGTPDFTGATPINPWNRLVGGTAVDNCQTPKAAF